MKYIIPFHDAGLLREYLVKNYGKYFEFGGSAKTYFHAVKIARRLAKMTGQNIEQVIDDIRADYRELPEY